MADNHFKKQKSFGKDLLSRRIKLLKPFIRKYGRPVLAHAIQKESVFLEVLKEGKLKLPNDHSSPKKTPLMEKLLKTDNSVHYSIGFIYNTAYFWKYNLIFDLNYLKKMEYFSGSCSFGIYKDVVNYWYDEDRKYFEKVMNTNAMTKKVLHTFLNKEYNGEKRKILQFWKIEKELFEGIENYGGKDKLVRIINRIKRKYLLKFPESMGHASEIYKEDRAPEGICRKENNLLKNRDFLGFYIEGKISKRVSKILKDKYGDKIIYDGSNIRKISEI